MGFPQDNGICLICDDKDTCPMTEMLPKWQEIKAEYGEHVRELRPDLWDEYSIDEPDVVDGEVTWCPMHHVCGMPKVNKIKHAAIIRSDDVLVEGKSHSDIINSSPMGTCKDGSIQGFIDTKGHFVSREEAYKIALEAGQLMPEKMVPKSRRWLMSEDIWSNVSNGDYDYDEKLGYISKE